MIDFLFNSLIVISVAMIAALGSVFYDYLLGSPSKGPVREGPLLWKLGQFLTDKHDRFEEEQDLKVMAKYNHLLNKFPNADKWSLQRKARYSKAINYWKALGACIICFNPWLTAIIYLLTVVLWGSSFWGLLPCIFFSSFILRFAKSAV